MSRTRLRMAVSAILVAVFATVTWYSVALAQEDTETSPDDICRKDVFVPVELPGPPDPEKFKPPTEVALKPEPGNELQLVVTFHRARGYRTDDFTLEFIEATLPDPADFPPGERLTLEASVIKRDSDSREENPERRIRYYAFSTRNGVSANVCFLADALPPGRYQSTVRINNLNITHTPIPLVITVQENNIVLMIALALAGIIGGTVVLYLQAQSTKVAAGAGREAFTDWLHLNWVGLVLGVGVVWGVFNSQYLQTASFGADFTDYVAFVVGCGTSFTGAGVAGSLGQQKVRDHSRSERSGGSDTPGGDRND